MLQLVRFVAGMVCIAGFLVSGAISLNYAPMTASDASNVARWTYALGALAFATVCLNGAIRMAVPKGGS
ncbi:MAG: hypothetical protein KDA61_01395 [Planctomycetales bacterium]|nr:hypothetical protein [Planctomycetales bacterium]